MSIFTGTVESLDAIMRTLRVRVPSNARSFSVASNFFSSELVTPGEALRWSVDVSDPGTVIDGPPVSPRAEAR